MNTGANIPKIAGGQSQRRPSLTCVPGRVYHAQEVGKASWPAAHGAVFSRLMDATRQPLSQICSIPMHPVGASAWSMMRSPAISSRAAKRKLARLALSIAPVGSFVGG
ncbi:hypothetical protein UFOVP1619_22 [uncultured Caudovirales phage]|uniref:Uncharacterized protein n=1 Tax=uncultured Caudovirales phage TaxID=2100421 RepID=A0A6J5SXR8_9CAUD|nr:hypothetical protein UFOVP1619_22 [uncultured Caudovirales phage]